jgi:two-component system NtrC family sensor kinase
VIAIENVRLFRELETRNRALTETIEQQTATGNILRVISSSPTDVRPVFDTIVESAARLCNATLSALISFDGDTMQLLAAHNWTPAAFELSRRIAPSCPHEAETAKKPSLTLGGHLKTGQLWTGQNRPVGAAPQAGVFYRG